MTENYKCDESKEWYDWESQRWDEYKLRKNGMTNQNDNLTITGTCPDCSCPIYWDSRDGEPVPHECQQEGADYVDDCMD